MSVELFVNKSDCCGCTACQSICPVNAIDIKTDEYGFTYPSINGSKCIGCQACKKICANKSDKLGNIPLKAYAGVSLDDSIRMKSSSGGIFTVLAEEILNLGGYVYGAEIINDGNNCQLRHNCISKIQDLYRLQGSKYMQSDLTGIFPDIKSKLSEGCIVLFCGTPCQVDGLIHFLKGKQEGLITIDILCHGVPGVQMFNDYLKFEKEKRKADVFSIDFRNKKFNRWSHGAVLTIKRHGKNTRKIIHYNLSSYYMSFMDGHILRDSCYNCKYSSQYRPSDITLGDFWGIKKVHPQLLKTNGGFIDETKGISCITVNTPKGIELLRNVNDKLMIQESSLENISLPTLSVPNI